MRISVRKLALMGVLTAVALIIFIIEAQVPLPVQMPGVKLGLANSVTLFALFYTGGKDGAVFQKMERQTGGCQANGRSPGITTRGNRPPVSFALMILVCRILLGALFTGRVIAFAYSLCGGILAFAAQAIMRRFVSDRQIWVCGAFGSIFHNIGQICAAIVITGTFAVAAYLPALIAAGVVMGVITGFVAQFAVARVGSRY